MAGTIVSDTVQDGTGNSCSTTAVIKGCAKVWVYWDGASSTVYGSYNVTSVTRNSTGVYTINFTTALSSSNYAVLVVAGNSNNSNAMVNSAANATGSCQVTCQVGTSAAYQDTTMMLAVHI